MVPTIWVYLLLNHSSPFFVQYQFSDRSIILKSRTTFILKSKQMIRLFVLDVGCGELQRGHVNVDMTKPFSLKPSGLFVLADGQHLPFRANIFDRVYSSHTIEHVNNPSKFFNELVRVARWQVIIRCPWRLSMIAKSKHGGHIHYFNPGWFNKLAAEHGLKAKSYVRVDPDRDLYPLSLEIVTRIWKRTK